jgi:hypothetical protein
MSKNIYKLHCDGDSITNAELNTAIADYIEAETALFKLGPYFEVTRKAVTMVLISLQDMQIARAQNRLKFK